MQNFSNIPIFIPGLACPFQCVFCNQNSITGQCNLPDASQIINTIERYLSTLQTNEAGFRIQVAFFGGSFTGLSISQQNYYLKLVRPYLDRGMIEGIRISTRPDYISSQILLNLKENGVKAIELGAQSMNDEVLELSNRGHRSADTVLAASLINEMEFELGLQMMIGLPGDTKYISLDTAKSIIALKAKTTRIYPTLVIDDTPLADLYKQHKFQPTSLEDAVEQSAKLAELFSEAGVEVLRIGLHLSRSETGEAPKILAGPWHPSFGELVKTRIWYNKFKKNVLVNGGKKITIFVNPSELNSAIGHYASNKKFLARHFSRVIFQPDPSLQKSSFHVDYH